MIALKEENRQLDNVIVSSCITLQDETSKNQVAGILEMVSDLSRVLVGCTVNGAILQVSVGFKLHL